MSENSTTWEYDLTATSQDRSTERMGVARPNSSRLWGVDGSYEGGVRPFRGFREVHCFDHASWGAGYDAESEVVDLFPIDFVIGEDGSGYGFVYRVLSTSPGTIAGIFVDYYNGKTGVWERSKVLAATTALPPHYAPTTGRQMSVSVWGRYVYVFVEGEDALAFTTDPVTYDFELVTNTGPGKQPTLLSPRNSLALGSIVDTGDASRPGAGQVTLTDFLPSELSGVMGFSGTGSEDSSGTGYGQDESKIRALVPGDYAFSYILHDSKSGRRSAMSEVAECRKEDFAVSSGVEPTAAYAAIEICYDSTKYDRAYIYRSVRVQDAGGTYVAGILHLDALIELNTFRTENNPLTVTNNDFAQSIYYYELEDKQLVHQSTFEEQTLFDENMPKGGASWIENGVLFVSSIRGDVSSSSEKPREGDSLRSLGQIRWSSLRETSPELFPPANRYTPRVHSDTVVVFKDLAPNVLGLSRGGQYFIRWGSSVSPQPMHGGYGVVNYKAADTVGSYVYFVSPLGLKTVSASAQLEDVRNLNQTLREWQTDLPDVCVAFDPLISCLFVMNTEEGEADILWFNTSMVTSLKDLPFSACGRGVWPLDFTYNRTDLILNEGANNTTYGNPRVERAFFVCHGSSSATVTAPQRVFVVEHRASNTARQLVQTGGHSLFAVSTTFSSGSSLFVNITGKTLGALITGLTLYVVKSANPALIGRKSVMSGLGGASNEIVLEDPSELYGLAVGDIVSVSPVFFEWNGYALGVQTAEDQMYGNAKDVFTVRNLKSLACSFTKVTGSALTEGVGVATWRGVVYKGNGTSELMTGDVLDKSGSQVVGISEDQKHRCSFAQSNTDFQARIGAVGSTLVPGVRIICSDVDFTLLSVQASGVVQERQRVRNPDLE